VEANPLLAEVVGHYAQTPQGHTRKNPRRCITLIAERLRAQLARDSEPPTEFWDPGIDGQILGIFLGIDSAPTLRGELFTVARIRDEGGKIISVWMFWVVLISEFARVDPQPGEWIACQRLPDRTSRRGRIYRDYKLVADREDDLAAFSHEPQPTPLSCDWTIPKRGYTQ